MARRSSSFVPPMTREIPAGARQRAIYEGLRDAVLDGRLSAGTRLASSRDLAAEYGVARGTVVAVLDQLVAEGYLVARTGSGTFVRDSLPDDLLRRSARLRRAGARAGVRPGVGSRAERLAKPAFPSPSGRAIGRAFVAHRPAIDLSPIELWNRLVARRARRTSRSMLVDGDPRGWAPLREAIAAYLRVASGVRCDAEQVIVVSGVQQALHLVATVVLDPGDEAWCEDPGYVGASRALVLAGARVMPVPVDESRGASARRSSPRSVSATSSCRASSSISSRTRGRSSIAIRPLSRRRCSAISSPTGTTPATSGGCARRTQRGASR